MLGLIGAAIFGMVYAGAWMSDDTAEKRRRAQSTNSYVDKRGILRDTKTGRKYEFPKDDMITIKGEWRIYNIYVEMCMKTNTEPKRLREKLSERYEVTLDEVYEGMMKYKNESWGDKYDRA